MKRSFDLILKTAVLSILSYTQGYSVTQVSSSKDDCVEVRAAYDLGSGSTTVVVAEVDVCKSKIIRNLLTLKEKVSYRDDLGVSKDSKFSSVIMEKGVLTLKKMQLLLAQFVKR